MIGAQNLPSISQLYDLIDAVPRFPISTRRLVGLAKRKGADWRVVEFYEHFPSDVIFNSPEDLATRSEMVEMMNLDEQPAEEMRGAEQ